MGNAEGEIPLPVPRSKGRTSGTPENMHQIPSECSGFAELPGMASYPCADG